MISSTSAKWLWRSSACLVFFALPLLLCSSAIWNCAEARRLSLLTEAQEDTTSAIIKKLEMLHSTGRKPVDVGILYLTSATDSLARAEIQERTTRMVADAGGRLAQVQLEATPQEQTKGSVAIQLSFNIDNQGLFDLLYSVEAGMPLFEISELSAQRVGDSEGQDVKELHVEMTVRGHYRRRPT